MDTRPDLPSHRAEGRCGVSSVSTCTPHRQDQTDRRVHKGAQVPSGMLPLSHGIEVLDVGPSIKGQCVQVPC